MVTFDKCIPVILEHEGGSKFTNNPNDPGGATKYGISLLFLKNLSLSEADIDSDGDIDKDDIKLLSESKAEDLYFKHFWQTMNLEDIKNDLLCLHLFDHGVNAGTKTAIKLLQNLVGVRDDGNIGSMTLAAINIYSKDNNIVSDYALARHKYYDRIIQKNPKLEIFRKGWYNRINTTIF